MTGASRLIGWPALLVAVLGLGALYGDALRSGFLNDDYMFIEEARRRPLAESLAGLGPLGNYYRPISRQLYFEALEPLGSGQPWVFHLVNFGLFLGSLAALADLLRAFLPSVGVLAGVLYFATLPLQRVNLTWVSCSQELLALGLTLLAIALFRRRRDGWAALAYGSAIFSKEAALPLPIVLAFWSWKLEQETGNQTARRLTPFAVAMALWAAAALWMRSQNPGAAAFLRYAPDGFLAAYVHQIQSLLGIDHPAGLLESLSRHAPAVLPLALLAAVAWWLPSTERDPEVVRSKNVFPLAVVWLLAFGLVTGPVVATWSGYYYTLSAVGGALLAGHLLRRLGRGGWIVCVAGLLWWHAGATGVRAFAIADRPWGWTSHLTPFYFQRAAALTDTLSRQLVRLEPAPPHGSRFFFATLPPWAGFQMGNGSLLRALYRDSSLASFFYSQFSESTAADRPCRFLYWDGRGLTPLYDRARDPFFQVGSDLLLFERPDGASHAFRRGLRSGESRTDHLYWLGWTELWRGQRARAEAAWSAYGARDDSLRWIAHLRAAHNALSDDRDTLATRRHLIKAIEYGIGRPEAHAVLGELLLPERPKYGLLELKVAAFLNPGDWQVRRELAIGLVAARLEQPARQAFADLERVYPSWRSDSTLATAWRTLERRSNAEVRVATF